MNQCAEHNYHYYPSVNEDGWRCVDCDYKPGEPAGYSPETDRREIWTKVYGILMDACDAKLIHISNGSGADALASIVAKRCETEGRYDQYSILSYALAELTPEHAEYWENISSGVLWGNDPRDRCHCGQLATMNVGGSHYCSSACMLQSDLPFGEPAAAQEVAAHTGAAQR
jgi:hypothetical protein